ncbi:DUF2793 domain-containing protein (plasmid) [Cereibacter sphaeroides]|uniref:DUF2793 domain-containing protein n=1 Tax=Cereibacter sphaeroides TaxID=1063 RepID=UPI000F5490A0|nr:DUF2793 domain-containing protein [Cereibacter sphaeroides]AZB57947.1 DUF2793 domain-containing protein [Cereibacter sphaeroides]AZB62113.1 DUF2793 domain-containing protein [Cereibacter sphaeroides]
MSDASPILSLPYILPSQAQKHVTHNEALQRLDVLVQPAVLDRDRSAPPAAPAAGARHLVGPGAEGAWAGREEALAVWDAEAAVWRFLAPQPGWQTFVLAEGAGLVFTAQGWRTLIGLLPEFPSLGIATPADATNRLAVAGPATLFTHAGASHRIKVNKAAEAETASLLFQSDWSGRAEIGLAGSDDFALKVSPDGTSFRTALSADRASGRVALPQGAVVTGSLTGSAVQASAADATPGRLLTVGAFGLGAPAPLVGNAGAVDGALAPGFYGYDSAQGSSGGPAGVQAGLLLHQSRGAGEVQLFLVEAGGGGLMPGILFSRARGEGAWSPWVAGGIVESAGNANGRYIRHQDGTQSCWQKVTTSASADVVAPFPAAFSTATGLVTVSSVVSNGAQALSPRLTGRTTTSVGVSVFSATNTRLAAQVELISMGRWY